jgi:hypothetical protein
MTTLYKLTDKNGKTQNNTQWGPGVTHRKRVCTNPELCSSNVLHAYRNVNLAFLLNSIHADINDPLVWECRGKIAVEEMK